MGNNTVTWLYANGSPEGPLSNRGSRIIGIWENRFLVKSTRKFCRRTLTILKHMEHSTTTRLYANSSPEGPLSNRGSEIAGIIFGFEKLYNIPTIL